MFRFLPLVICTGTAFSAVADTTRGIGVYPGDPAENYAAIARRGIEGNRYYLDGNLWHMSPLAQTHPEGEEISTRSFDDSKWMQATVPSTNFMNYVNAGLIDDPNYSDNIYHVDHAPFADDFWYRTVFTLPENFSSGDEYVWLNFDGVNWKAHIFLNGQRVGHINGAFRHGRFDVTPYLKPGENTLAVKVISNAHQGQPHRRTEDSTGPNGGVLGADNPTFHASVGWDWIPTIPGRNDGIWNNVYLSSEGPVHLSDPLVDTRLALPDTIVDITPSVVLSNNSDKPVSGTLRFDLADITTEKRITLRPHSRSVETFSPKENATLSGQRLPLWWPNSMGAPVMHKSAFIFTPDDSSLRCDTLDFNAGLRQIDFTDPETDLKLYVNGHRFVPLGGNWGFSEANLRYGKREYDTALDFHRRMNFTTIRNWVGQIGDEEFYDACDRNGVMVWQDFWLANPGDGPNPDDETMFMDNATDMVGRIRHHPSILLYCGRNEGNPPAQLNKMLSECVDSLHAGMLYIPHSAAGGVSGFGPYSALRPHEYFTRQSGKIHSERGMPAPLTYEGLCRTLPDSLQWPITGLPVALHDFTRHGAQGGESFLRLMEESFGPVNDPETFSRLAQWISYDGYRAMFESTSSSRQGLLLWMSHPAWPSMVWQTYDYYFEPTGAFFGSRKGCEPMHIQYNPESSNIEVVNRSGASHPGLTANVRLLDTRGKVIARMQSPVNSPEDTTTPLASPAVPSGHEGVYFMDLKLKDRKGRIVSENLYVLSTDPYDYKELTRLEPARLTLNKGKIRDNKSGRSMDVTLRNVSKTPAVFIRLNLVDADGDQILPVNYSDNYIHIMPGESRTVTVEWDDDDNRSKTAPDIKLTGINL